MAGPNFGAKRMVRTTARRRTIPAEPDVAAGGVPLAHETWTCWCFARIESAAATPGGKSPFERRLPCQLAVDCPPKLQIQLDNGQLGCKIAGRLRDSTPCRMVVSYT